MSARRARFGALLLLTLGASAGVPACARPPAPEEHLARVAGFPAPVLLVLIGCLRADALDPGAAGAGASSAGPDEAASAPFLARLAAEAVVFERAYASTNATRAAVASLLTGRGSGRHGCRGPYGRLADDAPLLPEVLAGMGYDTRAIVADPDLAPELGFARGWRSYRLAEPDRGRAYADARRVLGQAVVELDALQPPPSLLMVGFADPHWPLELHPEQDLVAPVGSFDGSVAALAPFWHRRPGDPTVARARALYAGEVAHVDRQLDLLAGLLAQRGQFDAAWVVVTSDHGLGLWDHAAFGATGELHEAQIRVPLIIRPPHGLSRGLRVREPFPMTDLAPTLLALLGCPLPEGMEGRSWADALTGAGQAPARPVLVLAESGASRLAAFIDGPYKLLLDRATGRSTLYDVAADPYERRPLALAPDSAAAEAADRLLEGLERALRDVPEAGAPGGDDASLPGWLRSRLATLDAGERDG